MGALGAVGWGAVTGLGAPVLSHGHKGWWVLGLGALGGMGKQVTCLGALVGFG